MREHIPVDGGEMSPSDKAAYLSKSLYMRGSSATNPCISTNTSRNSGRGLAGARGALEKRARGRRFRAHAVPRRGGRSLRRV